jgi:hypothetical protein
MPNVATNTHANGNGKAPPPKSSRTNGKAAPKPPAKAEPAKAAIDRTALITQAVAAIAENVQAMLPRQASDAEQAAADYWGASIVNQLAEAWRNKAKRQAVARGVLPDHTATPYPIGTSETVYVGTLVTVSLKVVEQADRVDVPGLVADLIASGVKPALLKRLLRTHNKSFAGAHIFTASLT